MLNHGTFPDELYRPILELLAGDKPTLYRVALSCQTLGLEAERVMYRIVETKDGKQNSPREKRFLESVTKSPRRAALVKRYALYACNGSFDEELWALLASGLRAMGNLESLTFREGSGQASAGRLQLTSCTFQLRHLTWGCHGDEVGILAFLEKQPNIQTLNLDASFGAYVDDDVRLSRDALGDLQELTGGHGTLKMILPGRPRLRGVRWVPDSDDPIEIDQVVLEAIKANVKMLAFGGYFKRAYLPSISGYLGNLEVLELIGRSSNDKLLSQLSYMPRLKRLINSRQWGSMYDSYTDHKLMATELFENSKSLEVIDIQTNPPGGSQQWGRWYRGRELPAYIDSEKARGWKTDWTL